jgi:hypothetical protein
MKSSHIDEYVSSGASPTARPRLSKKNAVVHVLQSRSPIDPSQKKKRGRPRKHANDAAKTAAYRHREQNKKEDTERRDILAWLIRRCKAMLSSPSKDKSESSGHTMRAEDRQYLGTFEGQLIGLSTERLQQQSHIDPSKSSSHRNEFVSSGTSPTSWRLNSETLRFLSDTLENIFNEPTQAVAE